MVWVCCSGGLVFRVCVFVGFRVFEGFGLWWVWGLWCVVFLWLLCSSLRVCGCCEGRDLLADYCGGGGAGAGAVLFRDPVVL